MRVFAAGTNGGPYTIEVTWRDGTQSVLTNAQANHLYTVQQSGAKPVPESKVPESKPVLNHF